MFPGINIGALKSSSFLMNTNKYSNYTLKSKDVVNPVLTDTVSYDVRSEL